MANLARAPAVVNRRNVFVRDEKAFLGGGIRADREDRRAFVNLQVGDVRPPVEGAVPGAKVGVTLVHPTAVGVVVLCEEPSTPGPTGLDYFVLRPWV